jgi:hypothetical protein
MAGILEISEQVFERFADFNRVAVEEMIGRIDDHELLRFGQFAVKRPHVLNRADIVGLSLHEELRFGARARGGCAEGSSRSASRCPAGPVRS